MRQPLRDTAAAQHGAFSTAQAMTCYSRGELRALVRAGHWRGVFTGTYRLKSAETGPRLRLSAAGLSIGRELPACLHTAAELHGFGVLDDVITHVSSRRARPAPAEPTSGHISSPSRQATSSGCGAARWSPLPTVRP
jgi:hypothetical protein